MGLSNAQKIEVAKESLDFLRRMGYAVVALSPVYLRGAPSELVESRLHLAGSALVDELRPRITPQQDS